MNEVWKEISCDYEVSNLGEVRNKKSGRVLHQFIGKDGYRRTQLGGDIGRSVTVHRLVAKAFIPENNDRRFVNHIDGNKQNNSADNLEWCTRSENMKHAYAKGLKSSAGIKNGRCKLSYDAVCFIRENYIPRDRQHGAKALAKRFGVAPQTISAIISGQNW